ncbi:SIS domain-containing protein [Carboxydochorda subterranea]|uniref:SIS domain-containing protein n=1 Tax=Carboxydichorda subterranea TaxID=3109565 RepID=A0ABZ1BXI9_9FIRM|nr:SIS domain-containing protein [Limnochorda sp. L945t]WRP17517.1 SIS domain-containing protein [Limnochorda sp. L945t]
MTFTEAEIASQPSAWRKTLESVSRWEPVFRELFGTGRVALVGAGSSYYVATAAAEYARESLGVAARAVAASVYRPNPGEAVLFISRSGTTTEVLEAAQAADRAAIRPRVSVTCDPGNPLATRVDHSILLEWVREQSVVQTSSATSALLLLRAAVDRLAGRPLPGELPDLLERVMTSPLPAEGVDHLVVLGSGWRFGVACEAALKAQEMALLWTERYVPLEYRHGPMSCAGPSTLVVILDPSDERMAALARDIGALGARVVQAEHDPMVELVRLQRLAYAISLRKGLDPDHPRHLRRSIELG